MSPRIRAGKPVVDFDTNLIIGSPELRVSVDRDRAADLGVNVQDIADTLLTQVGGIKASSYAEQGEEYDIRVRADDGFVLRNSARERDWQTASGRAQLTVVPLPKWQLQPGQLLLMTVRSHDQYNTTIYEENDRYRGIHGRRDIVFVAGKDLASRGLVDGDRVDITSHFLGVERVVRDFAVVAFDLPAGCVVGYFPELNPLVPLESRARESNTPTSKAVVVTLRRAGRS